MIGRALILEKHSCDFSALSIKGSRQLAVCNKSTAGEPTRACPCHGETEESPYEPVDLWAQRPGATIRCKTIHQIPEIWILSA